MTNYRPHDEIPLAMFGVAASMLGIERLLSVGLNSAYFMAAMIAMVVGVLIVAVPVRHWRYG